MTKPVVQSRRDFLKVGAASAFSLACLPSAALRARESGTDPDGAKCVLRVAVMSDVHFPGSTDAKEYKRFQRAIRFMYEYSAKQAYYDRFDALMVVGDESNHGTENEIGLFKKTMDEEIHGDTKTLVCMGNHEFYGGNPTLWRKVFGVEPNARYEVNGFQFIAVSPEKGTMSDGDYLYALDWFKHELAAAYEAGPEKPIFVFQHYPISPTVYGGRGFDDWGAEDLFDTLQQYPTVIDFSGHTHYPLTDPRIAWQGNFSAFGTSTLSYICHGGERGRYEMYPADSGNYAEFYVMEVYDDNSVVLKPYDAAKESFYDFVYTVAKPGKLDSYQFTDARYLTSARPEWQGEPALKVVETSYYGAKVEIPQAVCPDVVHSYRFDLERRDEQGNWAPEPSQFFWSRYFDHPMPESIVANVDGLEPGAAYRARVFAINPFMRQSERHALLEFTTDPDPDESPDRSAERPDANFIDVRIEDGKLVNAPVNARSEQIALELHGNPKVVDDELSGAKAAVFTGASGVYGKLQCSADDYRRLRRATINARFRVDGSRTSGTGAIFGNTESAGIELCVDYATRKLSFWATVGDRGYTTLEAPIEFDRWHDAYGVFDGRVQLLYVDGKEVARLDAVGSLRHPTNEKVRAFCVGADIAPDGGGTDYFTGRIDRARLYNWALTPEQIAALSK